MYDCISQVPHTILCNLLFFAILCAFVDRPSLTTLCAFKVKPHRHPPQCSTSSSQPVGSLLWIGSSGPQPPPFCHPHWTWAPPVSTSHSPVGLQMEWWPRTLPHCSPSRSASRSHSPPACIPRQRVWADSGTSSSWRRPINVVVKTENSKHFLASIYKYGKTWHLLMSWAWWWHEEVWLLQPIQICIGGWRHFLS